jgi:hypothetical protein
MAQDTQSIGQSSPQLDRIAGERQGWTDEHGRPLEPIVDLGTERTDGVDFSFHDVRANRQALGLSIPNMAGYTEPSMASIEPVPFARFSDTLPPLPAEDITPATSDQILR